MRVVHKFPLNACLHQSVSMPAGSKVLAVHAQHNVPTLWAEVELGAPHTMYRVALVMTGAEVPQGLGFRYVGTVLLSGDDFVLHCYVEGA